MILSSLNKEESTVKLSAGSGKKHKKGDLWIIHSASAKNTLFLSAAPIDEQTFEGKFNQLKSFWLSVYLLLT